MISTDVQTQKVLSVMRNMARDIISDLLSGNKPFVMGKQLHSTDGFYRNRSTKTDIWFVYYPEQKAVICKKFQVYGQQLKLTPCVELIGPAEIAFQKVLTQLKTELTNGNENSQCKDTKRP